MLAQEALQGVACKGRARGPPPSLLICDARTPGRSGGGRPPTRWRTPRAGTGAGIGSGQRSRRFLPTRRPDNSSRDNRSAVLVNAVKLQHVLGQIDAKDCCRHEHLSHTCVTAIYQAFREGGVHPITAGLFQL